MSSLICRHRSLGGGLPGVQGVRRDQCRGPVPALVEHPAVAELVPVRSFRCTALGLSVRRTNRRVGFDTKARGSVRGRKMGLAPWQPSGGGETAVKRRSCEPAKTPPLPRSLRSSPLDAARPHPGRLRLLGGGGGGGAAAASAPRC